jgi:cation diffusion facilitator CzcD-associated flavoprotein CzcO
VASKFGVLPHIRFNTVVVKNTWDAKTNMWTVETMSGEKFTGNVVVSAVGLLHQLR